MIRLRDISEDTALFPWNKATPYPALESTIAVAVALILGELTGHRSAGSIAAGSAFTVGFAVFHEAMASTLLSMGLLTLGIASATLIGSLGAAWTPVVLLLCVLAAVNYGLLAGLSATTGWIGQQCGVFVIVASYFANGVHYAMGRTGMVLLGGAMQIVTYALSTWMGRYKQTAGAPAPPLARQLKTRGLQLWAALRNELHWDASTTSYTVKLLLTLGVSTAIYRYLGWRNGYWAPMTALLVLKPQWASTLSRGIARLAGTLVAAAICALLALHAPFHHWVYFGLIAVTAWGCFALQAVNYAFFSFVLTLYTVFLFAFGGFSERSAADLRLINTALGGVLALLVDYVVKLFGPLLPGANASAPPTSAMAVPK